MLMIQPRFVQINTRAKTHVESQSIPDLNLQSRLGFLTQQQKACNVLVATRYPQNNDVSFGKRILNDENFDLFKKVVTLGKKWIEAKIPPIYDLKAGAILDCEEDLSLIGTKAHNTVLARENSKLKVSADISGENEWFEIEDKHERVKYSHFWTGTTNSWDKHYAFRTEGESIDLISESMGTQQQCDAMQQVSKRGLTFLLTGEDKA